MTLGLATAGEAWGWRGRVLHAAVKRPRTCHDWWPVSAATRTARDSRATSRRRNGQAWPACGRGRCGRGGQGGAVRAAGGHGGRGGYVLLHCPPPRPCSPLPWPAAPLPSFRSVLPALPPTLPRPRPQARPWCCLPRRRWRRRRCPLLARTGCTAAAEPRRTRADRCCSAWRSWRVGPQASWSAADGHASFAHLASRGLARWRRLPHAVPRALPSSLRRAHPVLGRQPADRGRGRGVASGGARAGRVRGRAGHGGRAARWLAHDPPPGPQRPQPPPRHSHPG
jgi:hypothetical protein